MLVSDRHHLRYNTTKPLPNSKFVGFDLGRPLRFWSMQSWVSLQEDLRFALSPVRLTSMSTGGNAAGRPRNVGSKEQNKDNPPLKDPAKIPVKRKRGIYVTNANGGPSMKLREHRFVFQYILSTEIL